MLITVSDDQGQCHRVSNALQAGTVRSPCSLACGTLSYTFLSSGLDQQLLCASSLFADDHSNMYLRCPVQQRTFRYAQSTCPDILLTLSSFRDVGGYKQSGIGRELGSYALREYTNVKAVHWNFGEKLDWPI